MCYLYDPAETFMQRMNNLTPDLHYLLICGTIYALAQWLVAWLLGPQLPCLLAAGAAFAAYMAIRVTDIF